jgi:hypothetical protein
LTLVDSETELTEEQKELEWRNIDDFKDTNVKHLKEFLEMIFNQEMKSETFFNLYYWKGDGRLSENNYYTNWIELS